MTTFRDIFRSSFLDNVQAIPFFDMALSILLAFGIGVFIFWIYKRTYSGVMYSGSFGVSLIALTMITTLVILAVSTNIVLSLGMVGALSIVRFRTAIKDPMDLVFLFWGIAVGIVLAAGLIPLAVFGSLVIGAVLVFFVRRKAQSDPYILMVVCDSQEAESRVREMLAASVNKMVVKSKSVREGSIELNFEVRLKEDDTTFINLLSDVEGVSNTTLVSYNGDYMG
jgi:uncharacterized membrane protein YhiD involved in acid resistance